MKLYVFQVAPNPTKVRLYLAEKAAGGTSIDMTQVIVNLPKGEQRKPEHVARNLLEDCRYLSWTMDPISSNRLQSSSA